MADEPQNDLEQAMNVQRTRLGLRWTQVARSAGMTVQNLLRIRKGQIALTDLAARGIERALQWPEFYIDEHLQVPSSGEHPDEAAAERDLRDVLADLSRVLKRIREREGEEAYQRRLAQVQRSVPPDLLVLLAPTPDVTEGDADGGADDRKDQQIG